MVYYICTKIQRFSKNEIETMRYAIKWEIKNHDNMDEKFKENNERFHYDRSFKKGCIRTFKSKAAAERQVARYKELGNDAWEITVVEM